MKRVHLTSRPGTDMDHRSRTMIGFPTTRLTLLGHVSIHTVLAKDTAASKRGCRSCNSCAVTFSLFRASMTPVMASMDARMSDVCASSDTVCMLRIGKPTDVAAQSTDASTPAIASVPESRPRTSCCTGISAAADTSCY